MGVDERAGYVLGAELRAELIACELAILLEQHADTPPASGRPASERR